MSQGYSLNFRMYMEGVLTPFKSATIVCTPNGVEANINMFATRAIYDIKPKTAVQIFYKDWAPTGKGKMGWRIMFDGFYSSIMKSDQSTEGRMVTLLCRDFRMDIRRAPAALSYASEDDLTTQNLYSMHGLFQRFVVPGVISWNKKNKTAGGVTVRMYNDPLFPLDNALRYIAGTAYGDKAIQKNGEPNYGLYGNIPHTDERGKAKCGFFLDAIVRGLWTEAAGGTSLGSFLNKRIRIDKRFYIPANKAGYNFWSRQAGGLNVGSYMMGNSRFVNMETAILSCASLFAVRPYATSTPSLIPVSVDTATNPNPAAKYSVDEDVAKFLIERASAEFGAPYILNESMLLPPMEFTAPPNCNIFLPPVCDRITWQYDIDVDITRGYYEVLDSLSAYDTSGLERIKIQVPNSLFDLYEESSKNDKNGRHKPPLTLEERYKGVNVSYGQVEWDIAANDAAVAQLDWILTKEKAAEVRKIKAHLEKADNNIKRERNKAVEDAKKATKSSSTPDGFAGPPYSVPSSIALPSEANLPVQPPPISTKISTISDQAWNEADKKGNDKLEKRKISMTTEVGNKAILVALKRHAILKFFNEKYSGRVVNVDMVFNPYPMCGFPGMFIDDEEAAGGNSSKTVLGMVQQIKHLIVIAPNGAEASTTVVMNNAHFVDEPVDIDKNGNALFMKPTDKSAAQIDINTLKYKGKKDDKGQYDGMYYVPEPSPETYRQLNNTVYDLAQSYSSPTYIYAKDLLSITENDSKTGESNVMYLDKEYDPQHVAAFYRDVFQHSENSFMVGRSQQGNDTFYFMYDTIHEASAMLRKERPELMYDYEAAMKFTARNVCSADAFYQGILGLSIGSRNTNKHSNELFVYVSNRDYFDDTAIYDEYFGVSTVLYNSGKIDNLKAEHGGTMRGPGEFSSILETMPITAFIQERQNAVKNYIKDANNMGQGIRFTVPSGR